MTEKRGSNLYFFDQFKNCFWFETQWNMKLINLFLSPHYLNKLQNLQKFYEQKAIKFLQMTYILTDISKQQTHLH